MCCTGSRRAIPDTKRYLHAVGHDTFEVIDAAAVEEAIRGGPPRPTAPGISPRDVEMTPSGSTYQ
jgi:hypothetical protein